MTFTVEIAYAEGPSARQDETFEDRASALGHALGLAEHLGRTFSAGDRGWPRWVTISLDGKLDISIQIVRGGLTGRPALQGPIAL